MEEIADAGGIQEEASLLKRILTYD